MGVWVVSLSTDQLSPNSLTRNKIIGIRSLIRVYSLRRKNRFSALPPIIHSFPLYQNIFRGEPAISGFVWHVAPNLRSSQNIATFTSSGLLYSFEYIHPAQG